ncbi:gamma-glutamyltransferase [Thermaurantiacus sp.]
MAATAHPLATPAAVELLKAGAPAADAAIAADAVPGPVKPAGCGIGGDLLARLPNPATKAVEALAAAGAAPRGGRPRRAHPARG